MCWIFVSYYYYYVFDINKNHLLIHLAMFSDPLMSLSNDPTLPNLISDDYLLDDLFSANNVAIPDTPSVVNGLKLKVEGLTIECNTLHLRLEIERAKRQRIQASLRQIRRDLTIMNPEIAAIKNELKHFKDSQNSINYNLDGENVRTNTLAFRSLTRVSELLTTMVPCTSLTPASSHEAKILLQELITTIQHFGVHYAASFV